MMLWSLWILFLISLLPLRAEGISTADVGIFSSDRPVASLPPQAEPEKTTQKNLETPKGQGCPVSPDFYRGKSEGWFWKQECRPPAEEKKPQYRILPTKVVIPWELLDKLDPDEIARMEVEARKIAVMYPTKENLEAYRRLLDFMEKKASTFMLADIMFRKSHPEFSYQGMGTSEFATRVHRSLRWEAIDRLLASKKDSFGLIILEKKGCPFCAKQKKPVEVFQRETGWTVKWVDADEHPAFARAMGTERTPDILLVKKVDDGKPVIHRIGSGLHTVDDLKMAIIYGLLDLKEVSYEEVQNIL